MVNIHLAENFMPIGMTMLDGCPITLKECHDWSYCQFDPLAHWIQTSAIGLEYGAPITIGDNFWAGGGGHYSSWCHAG